MAETIHEGNFYVTGVYSTDDEGNPAIETGELAITEEAGTALVKEMEDELRWAESSSGLTIRRFRLVDEGPVLDLLK